VKTPSSEWSNVKGAKRTRLITERKKLKLTQAQLADQVGVSTSAIGLLESSRMKPGFELSLRLQEFFNQPFEILFPDL